MCFVFISEQPAISAPYNINLSVVITEMKCLQRGTNWVFNYSCLRFLFKGLIQKIKIIFT
jgi:hypothetical protein